MSGNSFLSEFENIWLDWITEKYWTEGTFGNASDLLNDLEFISIEEEH